MPSTGKRYRSAPITEAVIEIRIVPAASQSQALLQRLADSLKSAFPKQTPLRHFDFDMGLQTQDGVPPTPEVVQSVVGMKLASADDSRVLQFRNNGMAYSHMPPYTNWERFRDEAIPLWRRYRDIVPDQPLARCALRYINRIDIPGNSIEPEDYFSLYVEIPKALPQRDVVAMQMLLQFPQVDLECVANVRLSLVESPSPQHVSFLLDIDIFRLGIESWNEAETWRYLDLLRQRKNEIFEGCITDKTRGLIDQ